MSDTMFDHVILPPRLEPRDVVPENLKSTMEIVHINLGSLVFYANEMVGNATLFHAIKGSPRNHFGWSYIPAKQAIVTVYNYRMAMDAVVTLVTRTGSVLKDLIDTKALEEAKNTFRNRFPDTTELRQAILHGAELHRNHERIRQNKIKYPQSVADTSFQVGGGRPPQCNLFYCHLQFTFQGKVIAQDVSLEAARDLRQNCLNFIRIFAPVGIAAELLQVPGQ